LSMVAFSRDALLYVPGRVQADSADGNPRVRKIELLGQSGRVVQAYNYIAHSWVANQWVGKTFTYIAYNLGHDRQLAGQPSRRTEYSLESASDKALPSEQFEMQHYLSDGESVNVTKSAGNQTIISYNHRKGDLKQQVRETELAYNIALSRSKRSSTLAVPAGIATALLLIGGAYCYIQDRRRASAKA